MEHFVSADPLEAWKEGWGWVGRIRAITLTVLLNIALGIVSYWGVGLSVAVVFVPIAVCCVLVFLTIRKRRIRDVNLGVRLHSLCHSIRDDVASILNAAIRADTREQVGEYREKLRRFHSDIVEWIALYFQVLVGDQSVNCAIRLAIERDRERLYVTVGRSKGMDTYRRESSQPIPSDKGIARALRDKNHRGVCIIRSITQAVSDGIWERTQTDDLHDVRTLMVAPINGYDIGGEKSMVGILYVTSARDPFHQIHIEPIKAVADLLGLVYPTITGLHELET